MLQEHSSNQHTHKSAAHRITESILRRSSGKTKKHIICLKKLGEAILAIGDEVEQRSMLRDMDNLATMGNKVFYEHYDTKFVNFVVRNERSKKPLKCVVNAIRAHEAEVDSRLLEVWVDTAQCGCCGDAHTEYRVKFDALDVPYVVCGNRRKRVNVNLKEFTPGDKPELKDVSFYTIFTIDFFKSETGDIEKLNQLLVNLK